MTTPAQARTDRQPNELIDNDDINQLALVANRADSAARVAAETAQAALEQAQDKLTPGIDGVQLDQLAPNVRNLLGANRAGLRFTFLWNGSAFVGPDGMTATPENSTAEARTAAGYAGTFRDYIAGATGPDANALGLMIDGDSLDQVA